MSHERFTHTIDDCLPEAIEKLAQLCPDLAGVVGHDTISAARINPALTRAVMLIGQAVNKSRDAVIARRHIDPGDHQTNTETVADARRALAPLALAYMVGEAIVTRTEAAFREAHEEGRAAAQRELLLAMARPKPAEAILSTPDQRGPEELLAGTEHREPPGPPDPGWPLDDLGPEPPGPDGLAPLAVAEPDPGEGDPTQQPEAVKAVAEAVAEPDPGVDPTQQPEAARANNEAETRTRSDRPGRRR